MSDDIAPRVRDQETDRRYNREPGIAVVPDSEFSKEMERHEQFPSRWGPNPGNPYTYRPFPKMLYRAEEVSGKIVCLAAPVNPAYFTDAQELERAETRADQLNKRCTMEVQSEDEMQKAMENGWRHSPEEACQYLEERLHQRAVDETHRAYEDKGMSEKARREVIARRDELQGAHVLDMPSGAPKRKNRPPKNSKD